MIPWQGACDCVSCGLSLLLAAARVYQVSQRLGLLWSDCVILFYFILLNQLQSHFCFLGRGILSLPDANIAQDAFGWTTVLETYHQASVRQLKFSSLSSR